MKAFVAEQNGRLKPEFLPAYAPELNPVEYLWGYWKVHELPHFCPKTFSELTLAQCRDALFLNARYQQA